jgi:TolA-binding protein
MLDKVKDIWGKYGHFAFIILLAFCIFKVSKPTIKIVEKTTVDTTAVNTLQTKVTQLTSQLQTANQTIAKMKTTNRNIQTDEMVIETTYPDGRIERKITKKTSDTSTITANSNSASSSTSVSTSSNTSTTAATSSTHTVTTTSKTTTINPTPFWTTIASYQYRDQQVSLGQGINLGNNFTIGILCSYKFIIPKADHTWDAGLVGIVRY